MRSRKSFGQSPRNFHIVDAFGSTMTYYNYSPTTFNLQNYQTIEDMDYDYPIYTMVKTDINNLKQKQNQLEQNVQKEYNTITVDKSNFKVQEKDSLEKRQWKRPRKQNEHSKRENYINTYKNTYLRPQKKEERKSKRNMNLQNYINEYNDNDSDNDNDNSGGTTISVQDILEEYGEDFTSFFTSGDQGVILSGTLNSISSFLSSGNNSEIIFGTLGSFFIGSVAIETSSILLLADPRNLIVFDEEWDIDFETWDTTVDGSTYVIDGPSEEGKFVGDEEDINQTLSTQETEMNSELVAEDTAETTAEEEALYATEVAEPVASTAEGSTGFFAIESTSAESAAENPDTYTETLETVDEDDPLLEIELE
jgi:hypothetical protein